MNIKNVCCLRSPIIVFVHCEDGVVSISHRFRKETVFRYLEDLQCEFAYLLLLDNPCSVLNQTGENGTELVREINPNTTRTGTAGINILHGPNARTCVDPWDILDTPPKTHDINYNVSAAWRRGAETCSTTLMQYNPPEAKRLQYITAIAQKQITNHQLRTCIQNW